MAITFNPSMGNPGALTPKGTYYATIDKAEMKQGKDAAKPPYLNITMSLTTAEGKGVGKLYDMLVESNHDLVRYKINRFITALALPLEAGAAFELADIQKIITGKRLIVDVGHDTKSEPHKAVVDVFKGEIYYPISQASEIFQLGTSPIINASDAVDAATPATPATSEEY